MIRLNKIDLVQMISNYNLGLLKNRKTFTKGKVQRNIFLSTSKGKFVLRCYRNRTKNSILFEVNLINYLKKHRFPVACVVENKQGNQVSSYKDKPYIISEFIDGDHLRNPNETQINQLIRKIAEMQIIFNRYKPTGIKYRWNYNIGLCKKLAIKEAEKINTPDAKEKLMWLKSELLKLQLPKSLPKGICHCDFHFTNILFKNNKFKALLDFDDANYTYKIYDLICLIEPFKFSWKNWKKYKISDEVFDFSDSRKVVKEYLKYRPLTKVEKNHLFDVYKLSILIDCIWFFQRGFHNDFYEKRKINLLNKLGRKKFYKEIFGKINRVLQLHQKFSSPCQFSEKFS